jgi:hypothetical protein
MTFARCCCDMDPTNLHVMKPALERWASMTVRNCVKEENTIAFCAGSEALICSSSGKQVRKQHHGLSNLEKIQMNSFVPCNKADIFAGVLSTLDESSKWSAESSTLESASNVDDFNKSS